MLAPDFLLFLIKHAETAKPLRNTAGFTTVCIFICHCFNMKEAKENCNLCSGEAITSKDHPFRKQIEDIKIWGRQKKWV